MAFVASAEESPSARRVTDEVDYFRIADNPDGTVVRNFTERRLDNCRDGSVALGHAKDAVATVQNYH